VVNKVTFVGFRGRSSPLHPTIFESYVTTERILSKEQPTEKGYLRRVLGVKVRDKEHRSEIRKARYGKLLLRIERSHHASLAM